MHRLQAYLPQDRADMDRSYGNARPDGSSRRFRRACLRACSIPRVRPTMPRGSRSSKARSGRSWSSAVSSVTRARPRSFAAAFGSTREKELVPAATPGPRSCRANSTRACSFRRSPPPRASSRCRPREGCPPRSWRTSVNGSRWERLIRATANRPRHRLRSRPSRPTGGR